MFVASALVSVSFGANPPSASSAPSEEKITGAALAAELRSLQPATNTHFSGILRIRRTDDRTLQVPITCSVVIGAASWKVIYHTAGSDELPVEKLTVIHFTGKPSQYFYARANQREDPLHDQPISGAELLKPLAESSFCFLDLGLDFFHWPVQNLVKPDGPPLYKGRACHVLDSIIAHPPAGGYARVRSWVDKESHGLLKAEAYDKDNHLLKEFSIRGLMKVDKQWQPQELKICVAKSKACTWIEFDP